MNFEKLTLKHFISDLPRIINKNFNNIKIFIDKVFTENESDIIIGSDNLHLNGKFTNITTTEIKAGNVKILQDGEYVDLNVYIQNIVNEAIQNAISGLER